MKQISKKYSSGFSIMILIVIILSIGIIGAVAVVGYNSVTKKTDLIEQTKKTNKLDAADTTATQVALEWITIGTQKWAKYNLNVGTRIAGATAQTNNGGTNIVEKYCYGDTDAGCINTDSNGIAYGGLYQWDEAMQYVTTEGVQGICPTGSHIPTDNDWKILEIQLGMSQAQADISYNWRGTDQGTQLKSGGSSGLNLPLAGYRDTDGSFDHLSSNAYLRSSSETGGVAWYRGLSSVDATVSRYTDGMRSGFSVRCLEN